MFVSDVPADIVGDITGDIADLDPDLDRDQISTSNDLLTVISCPEIVLLNFNTLISMSIPSRATLSFSTNPSLSIFHKYI